MNPSKICAVVFVAGLSLLLPPLRAERYALLVGISEYPALSKEAHLEAPPEDVLRLETALIDRWRYSRNNISKLLNEAASKSNILEALDNLAKKVKTGDLVFFYFSGHGTSALDPQNATLGIPLNSGALIPADAGVADAGRLFDQLIVGGRDLKPRLEELNQKALVFVVIDSCYSGAAVRSVGKGLKSRDLPLSEFSPGKRMDANDYDAAYKTVKMPAQPEEFPYKNLIFLSASSQSEKSYEATKEAIALGSYETIDGKPHGLLTDALLRALDGDADADQNGTITYEELHEFAFVHVSDIGQTPQLLPKRAPELTAEPLFGVSAPLPRAESIAVALKPAARDFAARFSRLSGITVVGEDIADLVIDKIGDTYRLSPGKTAPIGQFETKDVKQLLDRISHAARVKALRNWSFQKPDLEAGIETKPTDRTEYPVGEAVNFRLSATRPSYLVFLNIDVSGEVSILYKTSAGQPDLSHEAITSICPPIGTEYMKLFAFAEPPMDWNSLKEDGPMDAPRVRGFINFLRHAPAGSAEKLQRIRTVTRTGPGGKSCDK